MLNIFFFAQFYLLRKKTDYISLESCPNTNPAIVGKKMFKNVVYPWQKSLESLSRETCCSVIVFNSFLLFPFFPIVLCEGRNRRIITMSIPVGVKFINEIVLRNAIGSYREGNNWMLIVRQYYNVFVFFCMIICCYWFWELLCWVIGLIYYCWVLNLLPVFC